MYENYKKSAFQGGYATEESRKKAAAEMERERTTFMNKLVSEYGSTVIGQTHEYVKKQAGI